MDTVTAACDAISRAMGYQDRKETEKCKESFSKHIQEAQSNKRYHRSISRWKGCDDFISSMRSMINNDLVINPTSLGSLEYGMYKRIYHIPDNWLATCGDDFALPTTTVTTKIINNNTLVAMVDRRDVIHKYVPKYYYDGVRSAEDMINAANKYESERLKEYPYYHHDIFKFTT